MDVREKRFKLTRAQSAIKRGPSGEIYHFIKGREIGAINLRDEDWMVLLCLDINKNFLTCITDNISTEVKRNVITLEDVFKRDIPIPKPASIKVTKSQEDIDAEIALARSEERMAALEAENLIKMNLTNEYLTNESLETVKKAMKAIEAYLSEPTIDNEYKISQIEKYVAEDTRKTLHSRVDELLESLEEVEEPEKKDEVIIEEDVTDEEDNESSEGVEILGEEEAEEDQEVHRVSREEE